MLPILSFQCIPQFIVRVLTFRTLFRELPLAIDRGNSRKNECDYITRNINLGIVGNGQLGRVGVGLQFLKR